MKTFYKYSCHEEDKHKGWSVVECDDVRGSGYLCSDIMYDWSSYVVESKKSLGDYESMMYGCPVCRDEEEKVDE